MTFMHERPLQKLTTRHRVTELTFCHKMINVPIAFTVTLLTRGPGKREFITFVHLKQSVNNRIFAGTRGPGNNHEQTFFVFFHNPYVMLVKKLCSSLGMSHSKTTQSMLRSKKPRRAACKKTL